MQVTFTQLINIFGIVFALGVILNFLSKITNRLLYNIFGPLFCKIWTGWLGIPVHELGHIFFCIIFGHKINNMLLYSFNPYEIEHVDHSWNPDSLYQRIGNFFIGIGPLIFSSIIVYIIAIFLYPEIKEFFKMSFPFLEVTKSGNLFSQLTDLYNISLNALKFILIVSDKTSLSFWIFIYISLCISSWMVLSFADIKSGWCGFQFIIIFLFILNVFTNLLNMGIDREFSLISRYFIILILVFIFSIVISVINFLFLFTITSIYSIIRFRILPNPFSYL